MSARVPAIATTVTHDCGYNKTSRTAALAARGLRDHSCDHQRKLQERDARIEARKTREGIKRDCTCKIARHVHGTSTAYVVDKCRCRPCTDARTADNRQRTKLKVFGRYDAGRVDAAPVREHIINLMANGVSARQLASLAGLSYSAVSAIVYGRSDRGHAPYPRVHATTAEKILAVQADLTNQRAGRYIDSCGTVRRLQALVAIGWSLSRLAKKLGMERGNFGTFMNADQCTVRRALAVRDLYDQIWNQPQTGTEWHSKTSATKARNYAAVRGWLPPLAWDDDTIDNPDAEPDLGHKPKLRDTIADDVEFMHKTGASLDEISQRLGSPWQTIERQLHRMRRGDLVTLVKTDNRDNARQGRKGNRAA